MPLDRIRVRALREIKGLKQSELPGLTQNQATLCERKGADSIVLLEKFAAALDCTPDFLLGHGFEALDFENAEHARIAASRLAFDVFSKRVTTSELQRERCFRVVSHPSAPLTADGWAVLAEQIDLACPPNGGTLHRLQGGRTR